MCVCGARAHPCEATASGLLSLGSSQPSTGFVGGGAGPGLPGPARLDISLLPTWRLVVGPCFLVRRLPSVSFPGVGPVGGSCMSPHFEMLSVLFPENIGSHFLGISRSFCGNV